MESNKGKVSYTFNESEDTYCFTCNHVIKQNEAILYVSHDDDGDWQFLCGRNSHTDQDGYIISLKEATMIDQTLNAISDMPLNTYAERENIGGEWTVRKYT